MPFTHEFKGDKSNWYSHIHSFDLIPEYIHASLERLQKTFCYKIICCFTMVVHVVKNKFVFFSNINHIFEMSKLI